MTILADENMAALVPLFTPLIDQYGPIKTLPGRDINAQTIDADTRILLVRSVTKVDAALLDAAPNLTFVGTATIGTDHLDIDALEQRKIHWSSAPGCNAEGVAEYVLTALLHLAEHHQQQLTNKTIGIVGLGNTGSALSQRLTALGCNILRCDPPQAALGVAGPWYSIDELINQCDVISLHVPLTQDTFHLLDYQRLLLFKKDGWLINASRGEVVDNRALTQVKQHSKLQCVLDVWENEPTPLPETVMAATLATPHIAGYSVEGKVRGTRQLLQAVAPFCAAPSIQALLSQPALPPKTITAPIQQADLLKLCTDVYDLALEDKRFRQALPSGFDARRKATLTRREFKAQPLNVADSQLANLLRQLGFTIIESNKNGL